MTTKNFRAALAADPDPGAGNAPRSARIEYALSSSLGFGRHHVTLALRRPSTHGARTHA